MIAKPKERTWGRTAIAQALAFCLLSAALPALAAQWVQTTSLPAPYSNHTLSYANGYLYQAGGFSGGGGFDGTSVFYAKVNGDGTIGAWNNATSLPQAIFSHAGVAANGCVYVLGGEYYSGTVSSNVYYAKMNADGSLGSWQMTASMPHDLQSLSASVWNDRIYVIGGYDQNFALQNAVYSAAIQADGSLSAWTTQAPIPVATYVQAEAANGFLYVLGGAINNGSVIVNTVYYSKINTNGSLAGWNQTAALPQAESAFGAMAANGCVFSIGGLNSQDAATSNVYSAPVNGDGSLSSWPSTASLPQALYYFAVAASGSNIFLSGGESTASTSSAVYSLALPAPPAAPTLVPDGFTNGNFLVQLASTTNTGFGLLASTNLMTWSNIGSGFTGTNGVLQFEDTNAAGYRARYYRAYWPLP